MSNVPGDTSATLPVAPLRSANAIRLPHSAEAELISTFPSRTRRATDLFHSGPHSYCQWMPARVSGDYLSLHAPLLFKVANACGNHDAAPDSWTSRRNIRLWTSTQCYFTTLYRATKAYLAELTRLDADIVEEGRDLLVLEASFPDFVTTYVLPEDPPSPLGSPPRGS
jgi:hypothetical protein